MIYFQFEKLQKIPGEKLPRRKLLRNTYESTGPNDERYYVSNSSGFGMNIMVIIYYNSAIFTIAGTDASKAETESSGKKNIYTHRPPSASISISYQKSLSR